MNCLTRRGDLQMGLKKNLLIVDKNDGNRKILREMLYNTYNILEADNSSDAINMLDNETEKNCLYYTRSCYTGRK